MPLTSQVAKDIVKKRMAAGGYQEALASFKAKFYKSLGLTAEEAAKPFSEAIRKPPIREEVPKLEEVFQKGVEAYPKETLDQVFKTNPELKVTRVDRYADDLMKRGYDSKLAENPPLAADSLEYRIQDLGYEPEEISAMVRSGDFPNDVRQTIRNYIGGTGWNTAFDEPGLYWGKGHIDLSSIPPYQSKAEEHMIEGILHPQSVNEGGVIDRGHEVVQKLPGYVLARHGDTYKIIGAGGAALSSTLLPNDESEAAPISGRIGKVGAGMIGEIASSAEKKLMGREIQGKIVTGVKQGISDWRHIVFEDGTRLPVRKNVLADIMKEMGTQDKMAELASKDADSSKLQQAIKSLEYHRTRQSPLQNKEAKAEWRNNYSKYMEELGMGVDKQVPWSYIDSEGLYLPTEYVNILNDAGIIKLKGNK